MNNEFLYCIFDELTNNYYNCFTAKNDIIATRFYLALKPQPGEHLYCIGVFAPASGIVESVEKSRVGVEEIIAKIDKMRNDQQERMKEANSKVGEISNES